MRVDPITGGAVPAVSGVDLVAAVPGLERVAPPGGISVEEFANIPSERMRPAIWLQLARRVRELAGRVGGILILHGTDTMEETAFFLDVTIPTDTPIVLTGAQRAASDPDPDGPGNILDAATVATHPRARGRGVMIVMHGEIHAARRATKANTEDVDAFDSTQPPDLGWVRGNKVRFTRARTPRVHVPLPTIAPRVDIVPMYAGADDVALKAALARGAGRAGHRGGGGGQCQRRAVPGDFGRARCRNTGGHLQSSDPWRRPAGVRLCWRRRLSGGSGRSPGPGPELAQSARFADRRAGSWPDRPGIGGAL